MSVSPGGRSSPGFCHIPSQRNRPAQKQIICPIYRVIPLHQPLQNGPGTGKFDKKNLFLGPPSGEATLIPWSTPNPAFLTPDQGLKGGGDSARICADSSRVQRVQRYSAANASLDLGFAADIMKSLMRGTIS